MLQKPLKQGLLSYNRDIKWSVVVLFDCDLMSRL